MYMFCNRHFGTSSPLRCSYTVMVKTTMATIQDLVRMALEELAMADRRGLIPHEIKFHPSMDSVEDAALVGDYDDYGNFSGSLVMYLLLFPGEFGIEVDEVGFRLLDCLNGSGDREECLRFEGMITQKSGEGQNNYRTNLLEALICVVPAGKASFLQRVWLHVDLCVLEITAALGDPCWLMRQARWIELVMAERCPVTTDEHKMMTVFC